MNLKEEKVNSTVHYKGRIITLYNDEIKLPDGKGAYREYVKHPGGVCVVPLTDENEISILNKICNTCTNLKEDLCNKL